MSTTDATRAPAPRLPLPSSRPLPYCAPPASLPLTPTGALRPVSLPLPRGRQRLDVAAMMARLALGRTVGL